MNTQERIKYDIDLDIKILHIIKDQPNQRITITDLRNYLEIFQTRLEEHIDHLVKWNILHDEKPTSNGKARIISFVRPYDLCMHDLLNLKYSIDMINKYFG